MITLSKLKQINNSFKNMRGFVNNQEGVAAIEFAMVAPFIVAFMIGSINVFDGYNGANAYSKSGTTVVDLVTRQAIFGDDQRDVMFATAQALLGKYGDSDDFTISITSVENSFDSEDDSTLTVAWSEANISSAELENEDLVRFDLPDIPEGETVVLVELKGSYEPYIATDAFGTYNYNRYFIRRPRFADQLPYE